MGQRTGRAALVESEFEMNWSEFFHMGGYAFFVWTSYAITFAVIVANIILPILQRKKVIARIKRAIKREQIELNREST
jgi:heme exporter protein D